MRLTGKLPWLAKTLFILCVALGMLALSSVALAQTSSSSEKSPASDSEFQVTTLANGMKVVTLESRKVPLVTLVLAVRAGGMTETPETDGLTHLWEHMFFKGNATLANQEAFNQKVRQMGMVYNGDTSAELVRYYFTMPSAFLEEGISFMYDAIATPLLEQSELDAEIQVVLDEYDRAASRPEFDNHRLIRSLIYGDLAYRRDPLGQRPIIEATTREQLLKIKDEVFVPKNSALLISGDFDSKDVIAMAKKHFSKWENPKDWSFPELPTFQGFPKTTEYVMVRPLVQNVQHSFTFRGPTAKDNPEDTFAADVLISLLNVRSGRFYRRLIDSGLALGAGLSYPTQRHASQLTAYAIARPENAAEVRSLLLAEIREWQNENYFTQEQLDDVRRALLIDHKRQLNSPSNYIKTLAFWWGAAGLDYYSSYIENLRKISLDSIASFAKRYFHETPYIGSTLISPEDAREARLEDTSRALVAAHLNPRPAEGESNDATTSEAQDD